MRITLSLGTRESDFVYFNIKLHKLVNQLIYFEKLVDNYKMGC